MCVCVCVCVSVCVCVCGRVGAWARGRVGVKNEGYKINTIIIYI